MGVAVCFIASATRLADFQFRIKTDRLTVAACLIPFQQHKWVYYKTATSVDAFFVVSTVQCRNRPD